MLQMKLEKIYKMNLYMIMISINGLMLMPTNFIRSNFEFGSSHSWDTKISKRF